MCRSWKVHLGAAGLTVGHPLFRRAAALVASVAWGCTNLVEPPLPSGAVPMAMPPQYALWWRLTERCAAQSSDLDRISWYIVPGAKDLGPSDIQGEYFPLSHRIVVAGRYVADGPLVRHEMLHAILGRT